MILRETRETDYYLESSKQDFRILADYSKSFWKNYKDEKEEPYMVQENFVLLGVFLYPESITAPAVAMVATDDIKPKNIQAPDGIQRGNSYFWLRYRC